MSLPRQYKMQYWTYRDTGTQSKGECLSHAEESADTLSAAPPNAASPLLLLLLLAVGLEESANLSCLGRLGALSL